MKKPSKRPAKSLNSFSDFLEDPPVAAAFAVIGLIALLFSIMEFGQAMSF